MMGLVAAAGLFIAMIGLSVVSASIASHDLDAVHEQCRGAPSWFQECKMIDDLYAATRR